MDSCDHNKKGANNEHVRTFKRDLYDAGWNNLTLNNTFDSAMLAAVKELQSENNISVDGIIGTDTKEKMYRIAVNG